MRSLQSPIGERIHVIGSSCSGKSTLAARLAEALGVEFVELDALNWLPNWVGLNTTDPARLERRFRDATSGERWVVAGSYSDFSRRAFWPRLDTVIWLDLPMPLLLWRVLRRGWRRWRSQELLWGTNREQFWRHLAVWQQDSLLYWVITRHRRRRRDRVADMADLRWAHIRFVRLRSRRETEAFVRLVEQSVRYDAD